MEERVGVALGAPPAEAELPWWWDFEGFWRDDVFKSLVKHGVQIAVGILVAVLVGAIGPEHYQARALALVAGVLYLLAVVYLFTPYVRGRQRQGSHRKVALLAGAFGLVALHLLATEAKLPGYLSRAAVLFVVAALLVGTVLRGAAHVMSRPRVGPQR